MIVFVIEVIEPRWAGKYKYKEEEEITEQVEERRRHMKRLVEWGDIVNPAVPPWWAALFPEVTCRVDQVTED